MDFAGLNYWAVVFAGAASFIFGGAYYGLLSKPWMAAAEQSEEDVKANFHVPMIVAVIAQFVMAFVLAGLVGHLGTGQVTFVNGLVSAAFVWLGFILTTLSVNYAYQGRKLALTVIDTLHWLGVLLIQGAIIGVMGL